MNDRGAVVESVAVSATWDPLMSLRGLSAYSSLSERLLRGFLHDRVNPLPHFRVGGRVLVRRGDFDAWIQVFREPAAGDDPAAIVRAMQGQGLDDEPRPAHRRAPRRSA